MTKLAVSIAGAAAAIVLVCACSDESGPKTLADGKDIELVGDFDLGGQTLNVNAREDGGKVTGEMRFSDPSGEVAAKVQCADTETDGLVILGGTIEEGSEYSGLMALFIRNGEPDSIAVWLDDGENESCSDLLANRRDIADDAGQFVDVEAGSDIEID